MSSITPAQQVPETLFVQFLVGRLSCALPLGDVQEIAAMVAVTPLPSAQRQVLGVIDYHGTPCGVLDVRRLLNLPGAPIQPEQHLVVLRLGDELLAIPCDRAETVLWGRVRPVAAGWASGPLIQGLIQGEDGVILVLDPAHLTKASGVGESKLRRLTRVERVEAVRSAS